MPTKEIEVPKEGTLLRESDAFVLEAHRSENGNVKVLLFLPNNMQHFATGVLVSEKAWQWGHYFDNINDALYDFMERH